MHFTDDFFFVFNLSKCLSDHTQMLNVSGGKIKDVCVRADACTFVCMCNMREDVYAFVCMWIFLLLLQAYSYGYVSDKKQNAYVSQTLSAHKC